PDTLSFLFVTEFPMFEYDEDNERWSAVHHLFTSPFTDDLGIVESDPGAVRSHAYDLVCNGQEVASGSIRIHSRDVQMSVLRALGLSMDEAMLKFGHMLEAFTYGAPPHGGIAPGIDRTVALFARERDIREVIAFPKTKTASDLLMGAPAAVTTDQLREVHVELDPVAKEHLAKQAEGGEEEAEA
ncbi:MAG: aspartate--tRNA ligase, partial [Dehalococcoidia bacterium]|nr:aspartate--tRNA ligase [Dehalococcoidia bacterium]